MNKSTQPTIVKANDIVEAAFHLTFLEQMLVLSCISQIDAKQPCDSKRAFTVTSAEIHELTESTNSYYSIREAALRLYDRSIKIDGVKDEMRWLDRRTFLENGSVTLHFSTAVLPYLSNLSERFTAYKLKHIAKFRSSHAIRLYELLIQWMCVGEREVTVEWLRHAFCAEETYPRTIDFTRRVIDPSVRDINEHSNLWVEMTTKKTGRAVTHYRFTFGLKNPEPERITEKQIQANARPGETRQAVAKRLRKT